MTPDLERLRSTLGKPGLAWLVERLRARLERGGELTGTVTLRSPSPDERRAVDALLGRPPSRGATVTVRLATIEEILRGGGLAPDLSTAVEAVTGPIENRAAREQEREAAWRRMWDDARAQAPERDRVLAWLDDVDASGLLARLTGKDPQIARPLLEQALETVLRLPVSGQTLPELAASITGDSHALDSGKPLATLVLQAVSAWTGRSIQDAASRREAWAEVGVFTDDLSLSVLTLNLPGDAETLTGRTLRLHAKAGEPCRLTLRSLLREPPAWPSDAGTVYVCENPAVVAAAADRLGPRSAPLVCVEGQPNTAARRLLEGLTEAGWALRYHGDFDWGGIRIANLVMDRHGAKPWRFDASTYRATTGGTPLTGEPVEASWDPDLASAMRAEGRAVHEEQVLEELLGDLAGS